jgi:hypothetical protein
MKRHLNCHAASKKLARTTEPGAAEAPSFSPVLWAAPALRGLPKHRHLPELRQACRTRASLTY